MKFLDEEWFAIHKKNVEESFNKPNRNTVGLVEIYENCYGGDTSIWIHYELKNGIVQVCERGEGEDDAPEATFVVSGDYQNYVLVCQGKLDPNKALVQGKFTLEGNMIKAMGMLGTYSVITKCKTVPGMEY